MSDRDREHDRMEDAIDPPDKQLDKTKEVSLDSSDDEAIDPPDHQGGGNR